MKLLALVTDAYGAGGGIAQYNRDLLAALATADDCTAVFLLARHGSSINQIVPAKVTLLGIARSRMLFALRALLATRQLGRGDVIFCGHLFLLPLAVMLARLCGAAVWLQLHGIEAWQRPGRLLQWAVARVRLVTAVSRHTRRLFLQWAACEPHHVKVLPNTVGAEFSPGPVPAALQSRYATQGQCVLLTVSRLAAAERYKGHDRVMQALCTLQATHPELLYLIAGEGDDKQRLQALAQQLGLEAQVRFIGYVADADLPDLYRLADVFVMPSTGEGFGIVFLQAALCGTPVIAADADGSRDPLRDGAVGALVSLQTPAELAEAILKACNSQGGNPAAAGVFRRDSFIAHVGALFAGLRVAP